MRPPHGPTGPSAGDEDPLDQQSLAAMRDSEALVDLLAGRGRVDELAALGRRDPLVAALAGWVEVIDADVAEATARDRRGGRLGRRAPAGSLTPAGAARVVPAPSGRAQRVPWWLLSASAAAVISVMAVGAGLQDSGVLVPGATVEQSVESVESVLTAARMAAEAGDVAGAQLLLERARAMVAELPADEQDRLEVALQVVEQGVRLAEEAVRDGRPVPPLPTPAVPGIGEDGDGPAVPSAGPGPDGATPTTDRATPSPTRRPTAPPGRPTPTTTPVPDPPATTVPTPATTRPTTTRPTTTRPTTTRPTTTRPTTTATPTTPGRTTPTPPRATPTRAPDRPEPAPERPGRPADPGRPTSGTDLTLTQQTTPGSGPGDAQTRRPAGPGDRPPAP